MGITEREKPRRLPQKLLHIRQALGLSQNEMVKHLGLGEGYYRSSISGYELGTREPPLPVLLKYAEVAGVFIDIIADDSLDLPDELPTQTERERVLKRYQRRRS